MKKLLLDAFFQRLCQIPQALLLLDYDGTLAPFTTDRLHAFPYPGVSERLQRLMRNPKTRVVIISGRSLKDLAALLPLDPLPELWGSHGYERQRPDGHRDLRGVDAETRKGLTKGQRACQGIVDPDQVEVKPVSVAVHWRGVEKSGQQSMRDRLLPRWEELAHDYSLEVVAFDGGLELRPVGCHKGIAIATLLQEISPQTVAAYLGDDATDEDAFRALGDRGLKVRVSATPKPTLADLQLVPPEELLSFLDRWIESSQGKR